MKKLFLTALVIFTSSVFIFSQEEQNLSTQKLLTSSIENNSDIKKACISLEKTKLSNQQTEIENGINVNLSTGSLTLKTSSDGIKLSAKPEVSVTLPEANNLKLQASTQLSSDSLLSDAKLQMGVDILSDAALERQITLQKSQREVLEAERKVNSATLSAEKAFYTDLKSLLNSLNTLLNSQKTLYEDKITFEQNKAKGYASSSSTYRLSQMKVVSDEYTVNTEKRALINDFYAFYKECGYEIQINENSDFLSFIPSNLPEVELLKVESFNQDLYTTTENALWTNKINTLSRKAGKDITLSATAGYTYANSTTSSNTVDAGLTSNIYGAEIGVEAAIPVSAQKSNPAFTLSASINPNKIKTNSLTKKSNLLTEESELLDIESARKAYEDYVTECNADYEEILWEQKNVSESYKMYQELEKDLSLYYKQGLITESEYLSAKVNMQSYKVKMLINQIDFIIYNNNLKSSFVEN